MIITTVKNLPSALKRAFKERAAARGATDGQRAPVKPARALATGLAGLAADVAGLVQRLGTELYAELHPVDVEIHVAREAAEAADSEATDKDVETELALRQKRAFLGDDPSTPPHRRLATPIYVALLVVLFVGDLVLTALSYEVLGESDLGIVLLAAATGAALLWAAHFIGSVVLGERWRDRRALLIGVATAVIVVAAIYGLSYLRQDYFESITGHQFAFTAFAAIQLLIVIAALGAAFAHHNSAVDAYKQIEGRLRAAEQASREAQLRRQNARARVRIAEDVRQHVVSEYRAKANELVAMLDEMLAAYRQAFLANVHSEPALDDVPDPELAKPEWLLGSTDIRTPRAQEPFDPLTIETPKPRAMPALSEFGDLWSPRDVSRKVDAEPAKQTALATNGARKATS